MILAWRIVKEKHAASAFDGEGARLHGGRWNSAGTRVIYTSASLSLAALELLVHLNPPVKFRFSAIPVEFEDALIQNVKTTDLPQEWTEEPPPASTKIIGDDWVKNTHSAVLKLPSIIIQTESNYLINPAHLDFKKIKIGKPMPFAFDSRLL
jgi:RES domain-containing protein